MSSARRLSRVNPRWLKALEPLALRHLKADVPPGALRDALTPNYRMGCKRILIADDYYPTLTQSHVQLETTRHLRGRGARRAPA